MRLEVEGFHHLVRHLNAGRIGRGDQLRLGGPRGLGLGIVEIAERQVKGPERTARPGFADGSIGESRS